MRLANRLSIWLACFFGAAVLRPGLTAAEATQWSVQEITLTAAKHYANPYLDAAVAAEIEGPAGIRLLVPGFWDGGQTFRIRWTPTAPGSWKYVTKSADPGLNAKRGEIQAGPAAGSHGFLRRDAAHPYSFVFDDGTRYFLFGNTYYGLLTNAMNGGGWKIALDKTRRYGMNKVRFYVDRTAAQSRAEDYSDIPGSPDRLNLEGWSKADEVVRYMSERGIIADLIVFQRNRVNAMTPEQARRYLRYVLARYAAFPNVIWCLQNEWQYTQKPKPFWTALGELASREDPWARRGAFVRGLSIHQQTRYDWEFFGEHWYSHAIIQLGVRNRGKAYRGGDEWNLPKNRRGVFRYGDDWGNFGITYNWGHNVPVVNDEYGYIGEPDDETEPRPVDGKPVRFTREKHRRTMWGIYVAGGYGSAGDKNRCDDGRPYVSANWHDEPEFGDIRRLVDFYTTKGIRYWELSARNRLVKSGERVYIETGPPRQYVIYAAAGGDFSIDLGPGEYVARRYDPRTGEDTALGRVAGGATRSFSLPDHRDWAVYLKPVR